MCHNPTLGGLKACHLVDSELSVPQAPRPFFSGHSSALRFLFDVHLI